MRDAEATKQANRSVWGASPAGSTFGKGYEPGSPEFFTAVLERRSTYEQPWLPDVVPFDSFRGKKVLEIGCGAGYDAYTFMCAGADYTGIDLTPENPERVRKHLEPYGFEPNVLVADAEGLPFPDRSFDVVFSNGVLMSTPDMPSAFGEVRRVLQPGGAFYATIYNRHSLFYIGWIVLFDHVVQGGWRRRTLATRRSMIESTTSSELPLVNVYSRRQLRRYLRRAGFSGIRLRVRKLVAQDIPNPAGTYELWKRIPQGCLNVAARFCGWYICVEARAPLNG